jgi:hypothetical protein
VPGLVVDYRPPLFYVSWSDGTEQLLVKKELDYFRRIYEKHGGLAERRRIAREEKILKAAKMNGTLSKLSQDVNRQLAIGGLENGDNSLSDVKQSDRSALEWRLLELAASQTSSSFSNTSSLGPPLPIEAQDESNINNGQQQKEEKEKNLLSDSSNQAVVVPKKKKKEEEEEEVKGIVHIRNCQMLASGQEPSVNMWLSSRAVVHELHLVHCDIPKQPPAGIMALSGLEVLDLSHNLIVNPNPLPLPETAPEWAKEGMLKNLVKLSLRSNLLG